MLAAALAAGCATVPDPSRRDAVSFRWEVSLDDDSCGKLAGSLAMVELFRIEASPGEPDFTAEVTAELERRCPENTEPEAFDFAVVIPASACGELRELLEMAMLFDVSIFVARDRQNMVDELIASFEDELGRRCD